MRRFYALSLALVSLFLLPGVASAHGRFGATDLMYIPTSGTLAEDAYGFYLNFSSGLTVLGGDVGILPDLELGATVLVHEEWQSASLRAKYHLLREKRDGFGLAVGVQDVGDGLFSPYVVAGKTLAPTLQGYLGIGGGGMDGIFFGLSKTMAALRGAVVFVEYDSHRLNLGGRFKLEENLGLDVGLIGLERAAIGLSYLGRF